MPSFTWLKSSLKRKGRNGPLDFLSISQADGSGVHFIMLLRRSPIGGMVAPTGGYIALGWLPQSHTPRYSTLTEAPVAGSAFGLDQLRHLCSERAHYIENEAVREGILCFIGTRKQILSLSFRGLI